MTPPPAPPSSLARPFGAQTLYELIDGDASVSVAPARGALITHWRVGDRALLYLDEGTFHDPKANVRGGVPVLFPSPGRLRDDAWRRGERGGAMKQHGFARQRPWSVEQVDGPSITLTLGDDDDLRAMYPWAFRVSLRIACEGSSLRMRFTVENRDTTPMPFALGLHPYFAVADAAKAHARIPTAAREAWDNASKQRLAFTGFDLTRPEVDLHLVDHSRHDATLMLPDGVIAITASAAFGWWVVWTLAGRDFVCLEPWTAPGDALNTGVGLTELAPGAAETFDVAMRWRPKP